MILNNCNPLILNYFILYPKNK